MTNKTSRASAPEAQRCLHQNPDWRAHPELTRWVAPLEARFCVVCTEWVGGRDRQKFLRYVREALDQGKREVEIARTLELDGIADPFAEPPCTYLNILLAKSKYLIADGILKRVL